MWKEREERREEGVKMRGRVGERGRRRRVGKWKEKEKGSEGEFLRQRQINGDHRDKDIYKQSDINGKNNGKGY